MFQNWLYFYCRPNIKGFRHVKIPAAIMLLKERCDLLLQIQKFNHIALCLGGHIKVRVPGATIALKNHHTLVLCSKVSLPEYKPMLVVAGGKPTYYDLLPCNNLDILECTQDPVPINALLKNNNIR